MTCGHRARKHRKIRAAFCRTGADCGSRRNELLQNLKKEQQYAALLTFEVWGPLEDLDCLRGRWDGVQISHFDEASYLGDVNAASNNETVNKLVSLYLLTRVPHLD